LSAFDSRETAIDKGITSGAAGEIKYMTMESKERQESGTEQRGYADFQDHIRSLEAAGLLVTI